MTFNKCSKQVPAACIMDPQFHEEINRLSLLDQDRRDPRQNDIPGRTSIVQVLAANMLSEDVHLF
jgi:hypothetical protein